MRDIDRGRIPAIIGLGRAVGSKEMTNAGMDEHLGKRPGVIETMMRRQGIGIERRHWIRVGEQATSDMAVEALAEAIEHANLKPKDIGALYIATTSPDYLSTSTASIIQAKLGLPKNILGTNNNDACPGWIIATQRAVTNLTSPYGIGGPIAVVGAEVVSTSLSTRKPTTTTLFGDAAGATIFDVVKPDEGAPTNLGFAFGLDGEYAKDLIIWAGGSANPTSHQTVDRDEHSIDMNGSVIFTQATTRMPEVAQRAAENAGVRIDQLTKLVPHQANRQIIKTTTETLGIEPDKVIVTIGEYGNTSSASIPTALYEAYHAGMIQRNDLVGFVSFGAGIVYAGAVLPMVGLPSRK